MTTHCSIVPGVGGIMLRRPLDRCYCHSCESIRDRINAAKDKIKDAQKRGSASLTRKAQHELDALRAEQEASDYAAHKAAALQKQKEWDGAP